MNDHDFHAFRAFFFRGSETCRFAMYAGTTALRYAAAASEICIQKLKMYRGSTN